MSWLWSRDGHVRRPPADSPSTNRADFAKAILLFPVADKAHGFKELTSQGAVHRLLLEVNYFIQRVAGARYPRMPLGGAGIFARPVIYRRS